MSDTNRTRMAFALETTFRNPPSAGTIQMQIARFTGETFKMDFQTKVSDEIRDDRQISGIYRVGRSTSNALNVEWSYGTYDTILQALFCSAGWSSSAVVSAVSTTPATSDNSITIGSGSFSAFNVGQWIRIDGLSGVVGSAFAKIASKPSTTKLILSHYTIPNNTVGSMTITQGAQLVNGIAKNSIFWEKSHLDVANEFVQYLGNIASTLKLDVAAGELITGSFGFAGSHEVSATAMYPSNANQYVAATLTRSMSAVDDVFAVCENGLVSPVKSCSFSINNNTRNRDRVGLLGIDDIRLGEFGVTAELSAYFSSKTQMDRFRNFSDTNIAVSFRDQANNGYVLDFPRAKITEGSQNAAGKNQDVMTPLSLTGFMHETELVTARLVRFPGP